MTSGHSVGSMAQSTELHVVAGMLYLGWTQEFGISPGNTNKKYLVELRNVGFLDMTGLLHV